MSPSRLKPASRAIRRAYWRSGIDPATIGAAGVTAVAFYLVGVLGQKAFDFPAPLAMLFLAFGLKALNAISPKLQEGGRVVQKFFATSVTYPLLFSVGVSITPWEKLVGAFTVLNIVVIVSTVLVLIATGFFVSRLMRMYPIDAAVVCSCSAAQGGRLRGRDRGSTIRRLGLEPAGFGADHPAWRLPWTWPFTRVPREATLARS